MEHSNEYMRVYHNHVVPTNEEVHPVSERFMQDATNCINMNIRPPESSASEVKPVNFSFQTGEEFALEFMRDRVLPRKPISPKTVVSDPNYATGYMDLKGILGISRTESEGGPDMSMPTLDKGAKELESKNSSLYEGKNNHASMRSVGQNSSANGSNRGFHGYTSSGASDNSSMKIKVLCSFGGRVLPRPRDAKLRYVGGETRIIRISKDISWQELKQKTYAILEQTHTIKYQLPGEDLDALVSVCSDEDLQNMMEECNVLGDGEGLKKLRLFLFTSSDLEEAHYSMGSGDVDSEFQYVVAVNCMEMGGKKLSGMSDLASSSANDLEGLLGQRSSREISGIDTSSFSGVVLPPSGTQFSQPILPSSSNNYPSYPHHFDGQIMHHEEPKGYQLNGAHDVRSSAQLPGEESSRGMPLQGLPTYKQKLMESQPQFQHTDAKGTRPAEQVSGPTVPNVLVKDFSELPPKGERRHKERVVGSAPYDNVHGPPRVPEPTNNENSHPYEGAYPPEHTHLEPNSFDVNPNEHPAPPRPYLSMYIPREQGESLNRLTKSDDSLNPQFLMSHSRVTVGQQEPVAESSEKLQNMNNDHKDGGDNKFIERNSETIQANDDHMAHLVDGVPEASLPESNLADDAGQTTNSGPDILIDINDRFPRDFLSDIFTKAVLSEDRKSVV